MSHTEPDPTSLAAAARAGGRIGIDTEFMSERRYRALLCLVQVTVGDPEDPEHAAVAVLDPLAGFDPAPLAAILGDPGIEVVLHAGRQDVAILKREWGAEVRGIFDTQVAAGLAGHGAQTGYGRLLEDVLGVRLDKSASFTRWDQRPLTGEQLGYAREDVEHLLALSTTLQTELEASGRLGWAREECRDLEAATDVRDAETAYRRLPRTARLGGRARAVARELAAWREQTAEAEDRPPASILGDPALLELAKRQPTNRRGLESIRGLGEGALHRRGRAILAAIELGRSQPPPPVEDDERVNHHPGDAPLVALAEALVRARALGARVAYELVASRAELGAVVRHVRRDGDGGPDGAEEPGARALAGWRRELVGAELLELLRGRLTLGVDGAGALDVRAAEADRES